MTAVFETPWFSVDALPGAAGEAPYYVMRSPDGVVILPLGDDGRYVLIRQHRPARGRVSLEAPAGQIDPGETPEQAARRELLEETGCTADEMIEVGCGGLALNRETCRAHLFVARGVRPLAGAAPEAGVEVARLSGAELRHEILSGACEHVAALGLITLAGWRGVALPGLAAEEAAQ